MYAVAYVTYESKLFFLPNPSDGSGVSNVVHFAVEFPSPPVVTIHSPKQFETYNFSTVQLGFGVSKPCSWMGYSLDGQGNVTVTGNTTLMDLFEGKHKIVVYATDEAGNKGASEAVTFTISKPEFFSPNLVIGIGIFVFSCCCQCRFTVLLQETQTPTVPKKVNILSLNWKSKSYVYAA